MAGERDADSGQGWLLWVDREAKWKDDTIYLPEDVTQDADGMVRGKGEPLPGNAPTGGWNVLAASQRGRSRCGCRARWSSTLGEVGAGEDGKPRPYTRMSIASSGRSGAPEWRVLRRVVVVAGD